jgi:peptidylprolyl isomerase
VIDRFLVTQGDASANPGIVSTSTLGSRVGTVSSLRGPLRIAAPRTVFPTVTTNSGLQYRDIVVGTGASPIVGKEVRVHFTGMLADGRVFAGSRPGGKQFQFTLGVGGLPKGWYEGIAGMRVGSRRILTLPANLGYGDYPPTDGSIPKGAMLIFEVELVSAQS